METAHFQEKTGDDAPKNDAISHPAHYNQGGVECIDAISAATGESFGGFLAGNVIKYVWRYSHKNGLEDLKKARFYLDRLITEVEKKHKHPRA